MKGIIIYKGKYGATQQYAQWISEKLDLLVRDSNDISGDQLANYDFVVLGSSVYIGKLQIAKWVKKNLSSLQNKKIFLFQVAGAPPSETTKRESFNRQSLPGEFLRNCQVYHLAGRLIIKKLSWFDRFILKMGVRMAKESDKKTMLTDYDHVRIENIIDMVNDIRSFSVPAGSNKLKQEEEFSSCSIH